VDDTFCIFQNRTQAECFLTYLNRQHPNIEFTQELEENNSLPFLDILVTHVENGFTSNLYRKKTFTGLYTHFDSLLPLQYKINLISVLIYRAFHICSSYKAFHSQICNIKRFLQQNRFPAQLIDRIIERFLSKQYVADIKPSNVPKLPILLFLPYLGVYSIHLKKRFTKFIGNFYPHVDLKIVFRANKPIGRLFPFKDRVPSHVCSSVVYKFTCSSCQATYYGKISRHFNVRCREHLGINKKGNSVKGAVKSAITLVIVPPLTTFASLIKLTMNFSYSYTIVSLFLKIAPPSIFRAPRFPFIYFSPLRPLVIFHS